MGPEVGKRHESISPFVPQLACDVYCGENPLSRTAGEGGDPIALAIGEGEGFVDV